MNLYSTKYSSPLGTIVLESDGECLTSLRFVDEESREVLNPINSEVIPHILAQARQWLDDYFAGKKPRIIPRLNPHGTDFQKRVWQALFTIDYGQTKTYGEIAKMIDCCSAQAIGQALTRNLIAIIIPCHRVIAAHGKIGGYGFGVELKRQLLQLESGWCAGDSRLLETN